MGIAKIFLILCLLFGLFNLSGCKSKEIPEGVYKPEEQNQIWFTLNGRKAKIDAIKPYNKRLIFYFTVEHNNSTNKVERDYKYSLKPNTTIKLFGSSNDSLFLKLALDSQWSLNDRAIIQTDKKGKTIAEYSPLNHEAKALMELNALLKEENNNLFFQSEEFEGTSYRLLLSQAITKNQDALIKLSQLQFMGEAGEEHCLVFLNLLKLWGDPQFSKTISSLTPEEKLTLKGMLDYTGYNLEENFPLTSNILNQKD
jgi:hypothetical protein